MKNKLHKCVTEKNKTHIIFYCTLHFVISTKVLLYVCMPLFLQKLFLNGSREFHFLFKIFKRYLKCGLFNKIERQNVFQ